MGRRRWEPTRARLALDGEVDRLAGAAEAFGDLRGPHEVVRVDVERREAVDRLDVGGGRQHRAEERGGRAIELGEEGVALVRDGGAVAAGLEEGVEDGRRHGGPEHELEEDVPMTTAPTPRRTGRPPTVGGRTTTMAMAAVVALAMAACSSGPRNEATAASTAQPGLSTTLPRSPTTTDATPAAGGSPRTAATIGHGAAAVTFTIPDGWANIGWGLVKGDPAFGLLAMEVRNTYSDSCPSVPLDPPVGPSADDLAAAWADFPAFTATAPTDITIDGFEGKQVEFTVPDYDEVACPYGEFMLLQDNSGRDGYWAQAPNQHHQLWILDVDGTRLVIAAFWYPDTSPEDRAEIDEILNSIQVG